MTYPLNFSFYDQKSSHEGFHLIQGFLAGVWRVSRLQDVNCKRGDECR